MTVSFTLWGLCAGLHHRPLCSPCAGVGEGFGRTGCGEHCARHGGAACCARQRMSFPIGSLMFTHPETWPSTPLACTNDPQSQLASARTVSCRTMSRYDLRFSCASLPFRLAALMRLTYCKSQFFFVPTSFQHLSNRNPCTRRHRIHLKTCRDSRRPRNARAAARRAQPRQRGHEAHDRERSEHA